MRPSAGKNFSILPYLIVGLGIIISLILWYVLIEENLPTHLFDSMVKSLPWIALVGGILVSIVIAIAFRLIQLDREKAISYMLMSENFQREIAERLRAEESKQTLEKALMQGQKLQAIGTLAGGIAHDFNNILYAIIGYVEMAREDVPKDSVTFKNLGKVLDGAHRGQELIARILAFSRRQQHDFSQLNVKAALESVFALLRPTIPASVTLNLDGCYDCTILGNQTQLHQVFVNLINNAVDAMDGEGTVTIRVSRVLATDKFLKQFPKIGNSNYCRIDVVDTGYGMDQATMQRIFEPFFTTKEVGKGTGLGLATVHGIIEEHKGEIAVTSQLGHGSTFTLLLPEKEKENG